ncbi:hypothetical protein GCM10027612_54390 [Microbispora bryophytorum subsp. camponoti]
MAPAAEGEGAEGVRPPSSVAGPGTVPGGGIVRVAVTVTLGRAPSTMGTTGGRAVPSTSSGGRALSSPGMTTGSAGGGSAVLFMWADPAPAATTVTAAIVTVASAAKPAWDTCVRERAALRRATLPCVTPPCAHPPCAHPPCVGFCAGFADSCAASRESLPRVRRPRAARPVIADG